MQDGTHNATVNSTLDRDENVALIEVTVSATILGLAIVGNSCVLISLATRRKRLSRMHLMILHLSLADLFVAFLNVLPQLAWDITYRFEGGQVLCVGVKYCQVVAMYGSSYVLLATAIDRYYAICHPFASHMWSARHAHSLVAVAWCASLVFSLPQVFIFSITEVEPHSGVYDCWAFFSPPWTLQLYITWMTASIFVIPTCVLCLLYGRITMAVWSMGRVQGRLTRSSNTRRASYSSHPQLFYSTSSRERVNNMVLQDAVSLSVLRTPSSVTTNSPLTPHSQRCNAAAATTNSPLIPHSQRYDAAAATTNSTHSPLSNRYDTVATKTNSPVIQHNQRCDAAVATLNSVQNPYSNRYDAAAATFNYTQTAHSEIYDAAAATTNSSPTPQSQRFNDSAATMNYTQTSHNQRYDAATGALNSPQTPVSQRYDATAAKANSSQTPHNQRYDTAAAKTVSEQILHSQRYDAVSATIISPQPPVSQTIIVAAATRNTPHCSCHSSNVDADKTMSQRNCSHELKATTDNNCSSFRCKSAGVSENYKPHTSSYSLSKKPIHRDPQFIKPTYNGSTILGSTKPEPTLTNGVNQTCNLPNEKHQASAESATPKHYSLSNTRGVLPPLCANKKSVSTSAISCCGSKSSNLGSVDVDLAPCGPLKTSCFSAKSLGREFEVESSESSSLPCVYRHQSYEDMLSHGNTRAVTETPEMDPSWCKFSNRLPLPSRKCLEYHSTLPGSPNTRTTSSSHIGTLLNGRDPVCKSDSISRVPVQERERDAVSSHSVESSMPSSDLGKFHKSKKRQDASPLCKCHVTDTLCSEGQQLEVPNAEDKPQLTRRLNCVERGLDLEQKSFQTIPSFCENSGQNVSHNSCKINEDSEFTSLYHCKDPLDGKGRNSHPKQAHPLKPAKIENLNHKAGYENPKTSTQRFVYDGDVTGSLNAKNRSEISYCPDSKNRSEQSHFPDAKNSLGEPHFPDTKNRSEQSHNEFGFADVPLPLVTIKHSGSGSTCNSSVKSQVDSGHILLTGHSPRAARSPSPFDHQAGPPGISRAKLRTVKMTVTVVICYIVCWAPFFVGQMWAAFDERAYQGHFVAIILLLASMNSCTNPWIYTAFSDSLCRRTDKMLRGPRRCFTACCTCLGCRHSFCRLLAVEKSERDRADSAISSTVGPRSSVKSKRKRSSLSQLGDTIQVMVGKKGSYSKQSYKLSARRKGQRDKQSSLERFGPHQAAG